MASELRRKLRETVRLRSVKFWSKSDLMAPSYGQKTKVYCFRILIFDVFKVSGLNSRL